MSEQKNNPGNVTPASISCPEAERLLASCDELEAGERVAVEQHVAQCAACAAALARELRLWSAVSTRGPRAESLDPADVLLAQCRSELAETLDDAAEKSPRSGWLAALRPSHWARLFLLPSLIRHPVWSTAVLLLIGGFAGQWGPRWYHDHVAAPPGPVNFTVSADSKLTDQDMQTMQVGGINWIPAGASGAPRVELDLTAAKPFLLQGSLDDTDVKRVLTFVIQNGQRFDSGVRLDSVDVLRTRSGDVEVRHALCAAVRRDRNPGVRLKALEALREFVKDDDAVRQTLLDALSRDDCPGVRVEAINALQEVIRTMTEKVKGAEEERVMSVLRDRVQKDPVNYIRMQSAAAIRQMGPREAH